MNIKVLRHGDCWSDDILDIIRVKRSAWKYSLDSHWQWIVDNIKENDRHFLLCDPEPQAYLNLIEISFTADGRLIDGYGFGNLCSMKYGKGIMLMKHVLASVDRPCLSFCKPELKEYYDHFGWKFKNEIFPGILTMVYGIDCNEVIYSGVKF